jgi:hypothetical protein
VRLSVVASACILCGCQAPAPTHTHERGEVYQISVPATPEQSSVLASAPSCCSGPADFNFQPLIVGQAFEVRVDGSQPAYAFSTGKSFFLAYRLPDKARSLRITLKSFGLRGELFFPAALVLDGNYAPRRFITAPDVHWVPTGAWEQGHVEGIVPVDPRSGDRYLVVLTTEAALSDHLTVLHRTKMDEISGYGGTAYTYPYTSTGLLKIKVSKVD